METKPILSRQLFDISVYQRTSDGYFNATLFAKNVNGESGRVIRLDQFLSTDKTIEFINELELSLNENTQESGYFRMPINSTRGLHGGSWYHPTLMTSRDNDSIFQVWVDVTRSAP